MSNRNCLLSQKLYHYVNQGRTLNDILMRAAHSLTLANQIQFKLTD